MPDSLELPALYVEGKYDLHTIVPLLERHGVVLDEHTGPVVVKNAENDLGVLKAMRVAARASTLLPVGFVIDANGSVAARWQSIREHLKDLGLGFPNAPPLEGFIGDSTSTRSRIGVWIMPDNATDQARLEDFVQTLVPEGDGLIGLAKSSTAAAVTAGSRFPRQDRAKAELHCWLAWQEEPGMSFGMAIKAKYFRHDSPVANAFVAWFKRLYAIP